MSLLSSVSVCNRGIAFGIQFSWPATLLLSVLCIIGITYLFSVSVRRGLWISAAGFGCMVAGAWINLFERWKYGCVRDYFELVAWWPMFNMADIGIVLGACLILIFWKNEETS